MPRSSISSSILLLLLPLLPTTPYPFCICINCRHVPTCTSYSYIEEKHGQPHIYTPGDGRGRFTPRDGSPTVEVNIRKVTGDDITSSLFASQTTNQTSTMSSHTIEYDVVGCEDWVWDEGAWVRNMPEEIKGLYPDFVPT